MLVRICEKCSEYRRKTWSSSYKPAGYHRIGVTHAYAYCEKYEKRCVEVKKCKEGKSPKRSIPERLAEKIRNEIGIECDPYTFARTRAGKNQKAAGAFVWIMLPKEKAGSSVADMWLIGSTETASRLVKKDIQLTFDPKEGEVFGEKC